MFRHPAERAPERERGRFEQLAEQASFLASSPPFFGVCFVAVIVWAVGLGLGADDRFLTAISGAMTVLTLALVALVRNAEMRSERAIQRKLDAIASALLEDRPPAPAATPRAASKTRSASTTRSEAVGATGGWFTRRRPG